MMVKLSTVRAAIDLEPEEMEITDRFWDEIRNDRDAMQRLLVLYAKNTKSGIKSRLADFINEGK